MSAGPTKTSDPSQPTLAILAGLPQGTASYLGQIARLAGWGIGAQDGARVHVRTKAGALVFDHDGVETEMTLPVRAAKILRYLHHVQKGTMVSAEKIAIGPYSLMPQESLLIDAQGQGVRLTEKETSILLCLSRANGKPVTRQALLDNVWEYARSVETHTLETHIYRLRQKIEPDPANPVYLITKEEGYALGV